MSYILLILIISNLRWHLFLVSPSSGKIWQVFIHLLISQTFSLSLSLSLSLIPTILPFYMIFITLHIKMTNVSHSLLNTTWYLTGVNRKFRRSSSSQHVCESTMGAAFLSRPAGHGCNGGPNTASSIRTYLHTAWWSSLLRHILQELHHARGHAEGGGWPLSFIALLIY